MVHCNPAPPHPPPGEIYNVICLGQPYGDGFPVGYAILATLLLLAIGLLLFLRITQWPEHRDEPA